MCKKLIKVNGYTNCFFVFVFLFMIVVSFSISSFSQNCPSCPNNDEDKKQAGQQGPHDDEKVKLGIETEQDVDREKIIKDIAGMTIQQVVKYAIDLNTISKKRRSAIFALEYTLENSKEPIKAVNYLHDILGGYYAELGEIEKSIDNYTVYFKNKNYSEGVPDTPEGIRKYKYEESRFILKALVSAINVKEVWAYMVKLSKEILEQYPEASAEVFILADNILKREAKLIAEDELNKKRMKILQDFLDELAPLIEKHDAEKIFNLYRKHTTSDKSAQGYLDIIDRYYWKNNIKEVQFEVTYVKCNEYSSNCWWSFRYITFPDLYNIIKNEIPMKEWLNVVHFDDGNFYLP